MATEIQKKAAERVLATVIKHLDNAKLHYEQIEAPADDYIIRLEVQGDDLPMMLFIVIQTERGVIMVKSPEFTTFEQDKIDVAAKAICAMNYQIDNGSYALDLRSGRVMWTLASCFRGSLVGEETIAYLLGISIVTLDHFNERLLMLQMGALDLDGFLELIYD